MVSKATEEEAKVLGVTPGLPVFSCPKLSMMQIVKSSLGEKPSIVVTAIK